MRCATFALCSLAVAALLSLAIAQNAAYADYTDGWAASNKIGVETAIHIWRKAAWQDDDFLSEIKLGDLYGDERGDNKYNDPVEAYVWYYLASKSDRVDDHIGERYARRIVAADFHRSLTEQQKLLLELNADQREQARNRIVYILSCRGAEGYVRLGELYLPPSNRGYNRYSSSSYYGRPQGDYVDVPGDVRGTYEGLAGIADAQQNALMLSAPDAHEKELVTAQRLMGISTDSALVPSVIVPSVGEAAVYFHIADNMGHPLAHEYLHTMDEVVRGAPSLGSRISQEAAEKAKTWFPPYEYYPLGDTASGVPHTDECEIGFERERALRLVDGGLPLRAVQQALWFLGLSGAPSAHWAAAAGAGEFKAIARFQATRGELPTGHLEAIQAVRLIQTAAIRGDAASQNTLGVMYAKGIGVPLNYVRAAYWFSKSGDQRYAAALYHLGVLYKKGPEGIRQDLSKASSYFQASALAGFKPTMNQLQELLESAESGPHPEGHH